MCALSIKVPIRKKSGNLFNDLRMYIYIFGNVCSYKCVCLYIYMSISIYVCVRARARVCVCVCVCVCPSGIFACISVWICIRGCKKLLRESVWCVCIYIYKAHIYHIFVYVRVCACPRACKRVLFYYVCKKLLCALDHNMVKIKWNIYGYWIKELYIK